MKDFKEWHQHRQHIEYVRNWLQAEGYDVSRISREEIDRLIDEGILDRIGKQAKRWGAGAAAMASLPFISAAPATPDTGALKPYNYNQYGVYANQAGENDYQSDMKFRQENPHSMELPSHTGQEFQVNAVTVVSDEAVTQSVRELKNNVRSRFGRESLVDIIKTTKISNGAVNVVVDISGTVMASNPEEAKQRAKIVVQQICESQGISIKDLQPLGGAGISTTINQGSRSQADYAPIDAEAGSGSGSGSGSGGAGEEFSRKEWNEQGQSFPFKFRLTYVLQPQGQQSHGQQVPQPQWNGR